MNKTEHLLTILMEECAEVQQAASKCIRFGMDKRHPKRQELNRDQLEREIAEVVCVAELLGLRIHYSDKIEKDEKLQKYMDVSRKLGTLVE